MVDFFAKIVYLSESLLKWFFRGLKNLENPCQNRKNFTPAAHFSLFFLCFLRKCLLRWKSLLKWIFRSSQKWEIVYLSDRLLKWLITVYWLEMSVDILRPLSRNIAVYERRVTQPRCVFLGNDRNFDRNFCHPIISPTLLSPGSN